LSAPPEPLRDVIARHGLSASKALGQNFILDRQLLARVAAVPGDLHGQRVYEVGPGPGGLTRALLDAGASVVAVERDRRCIPALAELQQAFGDRCATHSIYSPHYDCQIIEVFPQAVNKWTGLVHLAEVMGVGPDTILAIGDDINDVPMLRGAALSFAMGNAKDAVKKEAKQVTAAHDACGVALVVEDLLAGKLE